MFKFVVQGNECNLQATVSIKGIFLINPQKTHLLLQNRI